MAGNQRTTPVITGSIMRVSADITREQQNSNQPAQAYYTVRIALPADELVRLHDIRLVPGMPAEVFIQTHERTPLQYLLKPLREHPVPSSQRPSPPLPPPPILLGLALQRRRGRVLALEPVRDRPDRCASRGAWT